jgi:PEP-CTERM motif
MKHFFVVAVALAAPYAFATVGTCTGGVTLNNYQPPDINSGCTYIDQSFTNIAVNSSPIYNGINGTPSDITLTSSVGLGDFLTSTNGLGVADFTSPIWSVSGVGSSIQRETDIGYVVQAHTGGSIGGYTYVNGVDGYVNPASQPWMITSVVLDLSASHVASTGPAFSAFIVIREDICLNDTTLSPTGVCTQDTGANSASILMIMASDGAGGFGPVTFSCWGLNGAGNSCGAHGFVVSPGSTKITFNLPGKGVSLLSVTDDVVVNASAGSSATLIDLYNSFGTQSAVPEPSTFALVGVAIGGLLWTRRRGAHPRS